MCKSNKLWRLSKKSEILLFEKSAQKNVFYCVWYNSGLKMSSLRIWVNDALHEVANISDGTIADFFIDLAAKSSSPDDLVIQLWNIRFLLHYCIPLLYFHYSLLRVSS